MDQRIITGCTEILVEAISSVIMKSIDSQVESIAKLAVTDEDDIQHFKKQVHLNTLKELLDQYNDVYGDSYDITDRYDYDDRWDD